jgi:hypothetical protein
MNELERKLFIAGLEGQRKCSLLRKNKKKSDGVAVFILGFFLGCVFSQLLVCITG